MAVFGCFALILFPLLGLVAGVWLAGAHGAIVGALIELTVALILSGVMGYALVKAGRRR